MTILIVVLGIIVGLALLLGSNIRRDITKKSDDELVQLFLFAFRQALDAERKYGMQGAKALLERTAPYADELRRRGYDPDLIVNEAQKAKVEVRPIPLDNCLTPDFKASAIATFKSNLGDALREAATNAYDAGRAMTEERGVSAEDAHLSGLVAALWNRIKTEDETAQFDEKVGQYLQAEALPFKVVDQEIGRLGMIEYIVWREVPQGANEGIIKQVLSAARAKMISLGHDAVFDSIAKLSFEWAKLL